MKLNNEYRFGIAPRVGIPRSRFLMHKNIRTTFNAGELIPIYTNSDIYPGDTFSVRGTFVCRMSTPIHTPMDNAFIDIRAFYTPHRIVWDNFKKFMGENETGTWAPSTSYSVPQIAIYNSFATSTAIKIRKGDILQYMGIPIGYPSSINTAPSLPNCKTTISALPYRAYKKIWNDWYRDENFVAPNYEVTGDAVSTTHDGAAFTWGQYSSTYAPNVAGPMKCAPVYKFKDYFNACLPAPQKGNPVTLPIGQSAPIILDNYNTNQIIRKSDGGPINSATTGDHRDGLSSATISGVNGALRNITGTSPDTYEAAWLDPNGTYTADLSNAVAATINAQRMAFATQRILEAAARYGTRYAEIIKGFFHVDSPMSAVLQRPEYLGGIRVPLSMAQVVQTSSTDNTSPQGNTAAYSLTVDMSHYFTKSFTEHGTLMILACVRTEHSYSQGIPRMFSRKEKLDFYWPQLAFLGEQAILNKEIFADGSSNDEQVFGYNERWVELRTELNLNTGAFSPDAPQSLDSWHYGDDMSNLPVLSDQWRRETKDNIDRTLAVQSSTEDQFLFDSRWEIDATRPLPIRSIPGLLDHF